MKTTVINEFIAQAKFNADGLITAIAQDASNNEVLMLAWMNEASLRLTLEKQQMVYFSRSRQQIWHKGEISGNQQVVHQIALDCDGDAVLAKVTQVGGIACHTGRYSCFYRQFSAQGIIESSQVINTPEQMYGKAND